MPLRRRLLALVALVLGLCLLAGGVLTYWAGLRKIELEMSSAIEVGASSISDALSSIPTTGDPMTHLRRIVGSFDGDRHLVASLVAQDGSAVDVSHLKRPADPPPAWLLNCSFQKFIRGTSTCPAVSSSWAASSSKPIPTT